MASKQELETLVKKLKEELRELRKEVKNKEVVDMPISGMCVFMEDKDYFVCEVNLNSETGDMEFVSKKKAPSLHMATFEAKKRMSYIFSGITKKLEKK